MYTNTPERVREAPFSFAPANEETSGLLRQLSADHVMQGSICTLLGRIADDLHRPNRHYDAAAAHRYLTQLLPVHVNREEEHLYMMLKRREFPGDDVEQMFELLRAGHADSFRLASELTDGLLALAGGGLPKRPTDFIIAVHAFNHLMRALVAWEDETILPYARMRL